MSMIARSSCSTGKAKGKYGQWRSNRDELACRPLTQSDTKQNEPQRSQPVKIAQLLGYSKSAVKDSERKRAQPERLIVRAITNTKEAHVREEKRLSSFTPIERNVRRNLNFNIDIAVVQKADAVSQTIHSKLTNGIDGHKNNKHASRKSFLLPPNSIKDMHLRRSCKVSKCSKVNNESIKSSCTRKTTNADRCMLSETHQKPVKQCTEPYDTSKHFPSTEGITNLPLDQDSSTASVGIGLVKKAHEPLNHCEHDNFDRDRVKHTNNVQIFPPSLQSKSQRHYSDTDLTRMSKDLTGISKEDLFQHLQDIQEYVSNTENNLSKLKLTLDCVTKILSGCEVNKIDQENGGFAKTKLKHFKQISDDVTRIKCQKLYHEEISMKTVPPSNATLNGLIQQNTDCKFMKSMENDFGLLILQDTINFGIGSHNPRSKPINEDTENKENCSNFISLQFDNACQPKPLKNTKAIARIMATPTIENDSFLNLERECNNIDTLSPALRRPLLQSTPAVSILKKDKSERPVQEYMRLKSNMNLLQTPDAKEFRSFHQESSMKKQLFPNKMCISNIVMAELCNLYTESPK